MPKFQLAEHVVRDCDPRLEQLLASLYANKRRPFCLCRSPGVEMYIAHINGKHVIKRMPNTGTDHDPSCDSYEPPAELSGLGQLVGSAIQENVDEGFTNLKIDFSLSKTTRKASPATSGTERDSVTSSGRKLGLRSTLQYLWEQAGFNRWSPAMSGKRSWSVVRKFLLHAADGKLAKGLPFAEFLYIPEPFTAERRDEIAQRRIARLNKPQESGRSRLWLLIGEVKDFQESRYGHRLMVKHLPDFPFMVDDGLYRRLSNRFSAELALWSTIDQSHLLLIGTFEVGSTGVATLEAGAVMLVTESWIPFEHVFEHSLIETLMRSGRRFIKGLRYNLPTSKPLASAVLTDTPAGPIAMYVVPPDAGEDYIASMDELVANSPYSSWIWRAGADAMPAIPHRV